ncbi:hypothetical protein TSAR_007281 [Trichomalopsis sarcophagae]|uniref:Uncharacterized protein n=1 Tax=Trichomalopsis sarcophagae TaxID=543379 RepID=A0A232F3R0_9HYME|nr:hypothetical protein TSAR_007281 [Trichomalopsis sarcophagae]
MTIIRTIKYASDGMISVCVKHLARFFVSVVSPETRLNTYSRPRKHTNWNPIIKLILEREPTLGKLLIQRSKLSLLWIAVLSCYQETAELLVRLGANLSDLYGLYSSCQLAKKSTLVVGLQMYPSSWNKRIILLVMEHF